MNSSMPTKSLFVPVAGKAGGLVKAAGQVVKTFSDDSSKDLNTASYSIYRVAVKIKDKKNAGTDDKIYIVLFGPNGSTEKVRLDNKEEGRFSTGAKTSLFDLEASAYSIGDIGVPFAITLFLDGDDAVYVDSVTVSCIKKDGKTGIVREFPFNGVLGEKGDFDLPKDRKGATIIIDARYAFIGKGDSTVDARRAMDWLRQQEVRRPEKYQRKKDSILFHENISWSR